MRKTSAHFRVAGLFDGKHEATVTITDTAGGTLFTVRPLHGKPYTLQLKDVAMMVHSRCVKADMPKAKLTALLPRRMTS